MLDLYLLTYLVAGSRRSLADLLVQYFISEHLSAEWMKYLDRPAAESAGT